MAKGKIVQVMGTVVDGEFPVDELPQVNNAIEIAMDGDKLVGMVTRHEVLKGISGEGAGK